MTNIPESYDSLEYCAPAGFFVKSWGQFPSDKYTGESWLRGGEYTEESTINKYE